VADKKILRSRSANNTTVPVKKKTGASLPVKAHSIPFSTLRPVNEAATLMEGQFATISITSASLCYSAEFLFICGANASVATFYLWP
jgi:hypothetical protein